VKTNRTAICKPLIKHVQIHYISTRVQIQQDEMLGKQQLLYTNARQHFLATTLSCKIVQQSLSVTGHRRKVCTSGI